MIYGLDVGGTKIELAIFDNELNRLESWRLPTPKKDYQKFLTTIADMVEQADQKAGGKGSVGIGLPGFVDSSGRTTSSNVPCVNGQPLAEDLCHKLNRPVGFENDVKAFVFSEANGGAADGVKHTLGIVLGTGLAGGLCIDGQLYRGRQNIAGEYGHIVLPVIVQQRYDFPLRQCGCGAMGCVEQYLSGPGLLWMCSHFKGEYSDVSELITGMRRNEEKALTVFSAYIDCLGCYFAELTMMFDPDMIVIGGGLSNVVEIYQQLPDSIKNYLFDTVTPPAVVAPMYGDSSGVRGAALIGRSAFQAKTDGATVNNSVANP